MVESCDQSCRSGKYLHRRNPSLSGVSLHEVRLVRDGPSLILRFDLKRPPQNPPTKWITKEFNTVQLEITLGGIHEVRLDGFATTTRADISLTKPDLVTLKVNSEGVKISATADTAFLSKVSAYRNGNETH
ncbi:Imm50 family immunity protein [Streptomyces physcomitrii]|uniref:Uncharacterized protein n=1 Tax=Streptomyces physcomitrii TaxID=2724184 RepID=A0ABX1H9F9_9ACTN|nr:hypothetical protein [Streptomyces physcomitrii]